ncbi:MAG: enoyl-CoA hydratase/isomerase family protein [Alphaproteobacteria bacterium]|nr:enoyl-CoA hydratase/isomerase family protein [Alphaproteobacteria bacterium]
MPQFIKVARDGTIAVITLHRPEKLNAWHLPMRYEIRQAFLDANADASVGAVVLTGSGDRAFSAGQDLEETMKFLAGDAGGTQGSEWIDTWRDFYTVMRGMEKPMIAALNGVAAGSAFQVTLLCDIRIGHAGVRMGQPEINSGIPSIMGPWLMSERIGLSRTVELALTGRMMDGPECHHIGVMQYLVKPDEVMPKAMEIARSLAGKPAIAMKLNKARFREATQKAFDDSYHAAKRYSGLAYASGEPQIYTAKFFENRGKKRAAG